MTDLFWLGDGRAEWRDAPAAPEPGPAEAIVRPVAVACCDLDVWTVQGQAPLPGPFRVGHEGVADIVGVGEQVRRLRVGERVIVPFQISCGACAACRRGRTDSCDAVPLMAMYGMAPLAGLDAGGFLADAVRVPFAEAMLVPLPCGVDPAAAASCSDNVVDGWRCVGPYVAELDALDPADRRVLVVGHGSIGLYAATVAVALGCAVDYVDTDPHRLHVAVVVGANPVDAPTPGRDLGKYPVTVSTRPDAAALQATLRATWPGGVCTDAAVHFGGDVRMPLLALYTRGVRYVTGRAPARAALPYVLDLLAAARLDTAAVTRQTFAWDDAAEAWPAMTGKTIYIRD
jgi:threonine dehydrogenase-like Zn-dependent dehydrogenase